MVIKPVDAILQEPGEPAKEETLDLLRVFKLAGFATLGFALIPAGVLQFVIQDKKTGSKNQLLVSGCSVKAYWSANFFFDAAVTGA